MEPITTRCVEEMVAYYEGDAHYIEHALKVYAWVRTIGLAEGLDETAQTTVELAAILHDIGIPEAMRRFRSSAGPYQEKTGAEVAGPILARLGCDSEMSVKILFMIGHHHSYRTQGGQELQILFEADFLVNLAEGNLPDESAQGVYGKYFKTASGKRLMESMYGLREKW